MPYDKTVLPCGIGVVTMTMADVRSISLGICVSVGSRDELPDEAGMSHFMEHMMFKGTPTYSAAEISAEFERMGAEFNAFTTKEYTCYYARFVDEKLERATEILADMVANSTFLSSEIVNEREVVIEEIARSEDTPDDYVHDLFAGALLPGHPLGLPIIGTRESVARFDHDDCVSYHERHYHTGNLTVVAAGAVDHERLCDLVERDLGDMRQRDAEPRPDQPPAPSRPHAFLRKETEQAHLIYGMRSLPADHPDRFAETLLDLAVGGGMSSRLFQEVREKRGLVYSIYTTTTFYSGCGYTGTYAGTRPANIAEVVSLIRAEYARVAKGGITADELERVRDFAKGTVILSGEGTRDNMLRMGKQAAMRCSLLTLDDLLAAYDAVTLEDVCRMADETYARTPTLAIISPMDDDELEKMLL
ncbi:MAG: pitrilysin family protein [Actinomycetota bacterium]|nr:pitrilysin family protein [Actinomycetota bacterium]